MFAHNNRYDTKPKSHLPKPTTQRNTIHTNTGSSAAFIARKLLYKRLFTQDFL